MNITGLKEIYMYLLGAFIVCCAVITVLVLVFYQVPENNRDMVNISLGTILGMSVNVVGYFFGSSKSSADKTEHIKDMKSVTDNNNVIINENN